MSDDKNIKDDLNDMLGDAKEKAKDFAEDAKETASEFTENMDRMLSKRDSGE